MATGEGIAAQLPYLKGLLEFQRATKDTGGRQRISLIWQLNQECKLFSKSCIESKLALSDHEDWICDWMDQLLNEGSETMVSISI